MRFAMLALVLAGLVGLVGLVGFGASGAWAQPRLLTVQDQAAPAVAAPDVTPQPDSPAIEPAPPEPAAQPVPSKIQDQVPSEADRQDRLPLPSARYGFQKVYDGYLRLDRETGDIAFCASREARWRCETVPQERAQLEKQIDALRDEVKEMASLRDQAKRDRAKEVETLREQVKDMTSLREQVKTLQDEVAALRAPPPPPPPAPPPKQDGLTIKLPTGQDIARARGFFVETWHHLVDMLAQWRKDVLGKG